MKKIILAVLIIFFLLGDIAAAQDSIKTTILKPELILEENENDPDYIFNKIWNMTIDSDNNIYLLDLGDCIVRKFDKDGKFIKNFGNKGQGPGEFTYPMNIFYTEGKIVVAERNQLHIFNTDGVITDTVKQQRLSMRLVLFNTNIYADIVEDDPNKQWNLILHNISKKENAVIASVPYGDRVQNDGFSSFMMMLEYYLYDFDSHGNLIYGYCDDYSIFKYDGKKKINLFSKKLTPLERPQDANKHLEQIISERNLKMKLRTKSFITFEIQVDEKDNIYVFVHSIEFSGIDVYSPEGKFQRKIKIGTFNNEVIKGSQIISNGYMWILSHDDEKGYKLYRAKM